MIALAFSIGAASMSVGRAEIKYQVKKGDNLFKIGQKFGVPYDQIMARNGLERTVIFPNQQLVIPLSPAEKGAAASVKSADAKESSPFASAKKLPETKPLARVEGELGGGYRTSPYKNPPIFQREAEPKVIAHQIPVLATTPPKNQAARPQLARAPESRGLLRSREVAAAAHYPGPESGDGVLNPGHFPMPSFSNPSKPIPAPVLAGVSHAQIYTVCAGDSVSSICQKFGVGAYRLRKENNIMFSRVHPGMQLRIPD